jgi:chemotaxis protein CheD
MSLAKDTYFDRRFESLMLRVLPCEYAVSRDPIIMVTGLGSCVAVCLIDATAGVCGMNHFMLPEATVATDLCHSPSARYGAHAMELLINRCMQLGAQRSALVAKVYGGASVLNNNSDIGSNNQKFALTYLERESIPVVSSDMGGVCARKIFLHVPSGKVTVEVMNSMATIVASENQRRRELGLSQAQRKELGVDIFEGQLE